MAPTITFSPQTVLDAARKRHPTFAKQAFWADADIVDDYNAIVDELVEAALDPERGDPSALVQQLAPITVTGKDGEVIDVVAAEGDILNLRVVQATKYGDLKHVHLRDVQHRPYVADEYEDSDAPAGVLTWNQLERRWEIEELIGWAGVTAIQPYAVIRPAPTTSGTLGDDTALPVQAFKPLTEKMALLFGQRGNLDPTWRNEQEARYQKALNRWLGRVRTATASAGR